MSIDWSSDFSVYLQGFSNGFQLHLVAFAVWMTIHVLTHYGLTGTSILNDAVKSLKEKDAAKGKVKDDAKYISHVKSDISNKMTALIHALVSSCFAINAIMDPRVTNITTTDAYTLDALNNLACIISSGYFIYDFVFAIYERSLTFFLHGTLSYAIFGHSPYAFLNNVGAAYLIYEVSTIFLNLRALMIATGKTKSALFNPIQMLFFVSFMVVRMGWGTWYSLFHMQPFLYKLFTGQLDRLPHSYIAVFIFSLNNGALQCLNIMWSGMMFKTIKQQFFGKKIDKKVKKTE